MQISPVELRHKLHQTPELMFNEFETTKILIENIEKFDSIKIHRPLETGILVEYKVNESDFLLFRADIDALPIKEENEIPFKSTNENMHACGHDVHSAILYGFLKFVVENKIDQNILFLFQPGEEGGGGAEKVIESGIFNRFKIKNAFALHVTDEYESGTIASTPGVLFASAFEIDVEIIGKSAHVAFPENGIHAFDGLRLFLDEIQNVIKNSEEKIIFGYGKVYSGTARNIIPAHAKAECTIRSLNSDLSLEFYKKIVQVLDSIKSKMKIEYKITKGSLYKEVKVDQNLFHLIQKNLSKDFNFIDCGLKMTGEDFGFFTKMYPSFMFWLGTSKGEKHGLHTPKFLPDDNIIETGIDIFKRILTI